MLFLSNMAHKKHSMTGHARLKYSNPNRHVLRQVKVKNKLSHFDKGKHDRCEYTGLT